MTRTLSDFHILLIEDSRADAKIIERALRDTQVDHRLTVITDGRQALDFLVNLKDEPNATELEPDIILLDLNLPGLNGVQVLRRLKSDPHLGAIPVIVLTTSIREEDVVQAYKDGANTYIPKPAEYPKYCELIKTLRRYWGDTALRIPKHLRYANGNAISRSLDSTSAPSLADNSEL